LNADRAPQLKASVRWLRLMNQAKEEECEYFKTSWRIRNRPSLDY
jgi:hypothetical protein